MRPRSIVLATLAGGLLALPARPPAWASSHREAPFITKNPKVDGTDFYLFRSYETGRSGFVTLIANYIPLEDPYGGPNYFTLDPEALYEIHIDNDGDAVEDLTFQFRFQSHLAGGTGIALDVGPAGSTKSVAIPLRNAGALGSGSTAALNESETYTVKLVRGPRRSGTAVDVTNAADGSATFVKPIDNVGEKTFADYAGYADDYVYGVTIPGCDAGGRVFVGQRREGFRVNLGNVFDLVNLEGGEVLGPRDGEQSDTDGKNVTSIALEVPTSCLVASGGSTTIGGWTTASVRQARVINPTGNYAAPTREGGAWAQVSRLGMPLVNEIVIGLKDKDLFNTAHPTVDAALLDYVTNPTLPELVEILFGAAGVQAPNAFPRADLIAAFLTGVTGVNATATPSEMVRLNTAIDPTAAGSQNDLGAALCFVAGVLTLSNPGCDPAGFPNGRRPGDDVVDIELRVAMGVLLPATDAPSGDLPFTDGALVNASQFDTAFPYLRTPYPGGATAD